MPDAPVITDAFRYSNYVEGFFWIAVGLLARRAARDRRCPRHGRALLVTFILFGCSDWVESTTGAWWRPWWLFAWKAAGIVAVLGIVLHARYRLTFSDMPENKGDDQPAT